jgi:hypothetical protein
LETQLGAETNTRHPLLQEQDQKQIDAMWSILLEGIKTWVPYVSNILKVAKVANAVVAVVAPATPAAMARPDDIRASEMALGLAAGTLNPLYFLADRRAAGEVLRKHGGIVFILRMSCGPNLNFYCWPDVVPDLEWQRTFGALYRLVENEQTTGEYLVVTGEDRNVEARVWQREGHSSKSKPKTQHVPTGHDKRSTAIRKYQHQQR